MCCSTAQALTEFIFELVSKEKDAEKRAKLVALSMGPEEWTRVRLFCNLLQASQMYY